MINRASQKNETQMEERLASAVLYSKRVSHVNCIVERVDGRCFFRRIGELFWQLLLYIHTLYIVASALDDFEGERARGPPINSNNTVCSKSRPIVKLIGHIASTDQYCLTKVKTIFLFKYKSRNQLKSKSIRRQKITYKR